MIFCSWFFFKKSLKKCSGSNLIFRCLTFDFSLSLIHFFVKRKANSAIKQQKKKVTKNMIDIEFRKWKLFFRFLGEIKTFLLDPVFSNFS